MPVYSGKFDNVSHHDIEIYEKASSGKEGKGPKKGAIRITPVSVAWKGPRERAWKKVPLNKFIEWISEPGSGAKPTRS